MKINAPKEDNKDNCINTNTVTKEMLGTIVQYLHVDAFYWVRLITSSHGTAKRSLRNPQQSKFA